MADCLTQLFWPHDVPLNLFFIITFVLKCFLSCCTTFLAAYFVKNFVKDEMNVKTKMIYLCGIGSIFFMFAPWPQLIQTIFLYYQYTASENEINTMEKSCNLSLVETTNVLRFLYSLFTCVGLGLTVGIYYERLKLCFNDSVFAIGRCISQCIIVYFAYVNICVYRYTSCSYSFDDKKKYSGFVCVCVMMMNE